MHDRETINPPSSVPKGRVWAFVAVLVTTVAFGTGYVWVVTRNASPTLALEPSAKPVRAVLELGRPLLMVRNLLTNRYNRIDLVPLGGRAGPHGVAPFQCDRVHFRSGLGICVLALNEPFDPQVQVTLFDTKFKTRFRLLVPGLQASRARVSTDGRYASTTVFVRGHSYADAQFSTKALIFDTGTGKSLGNLERWPVLKDGRPLRAADFNYWGVSFARDSDRFYATLQTGGVPYLVEGDLRTQRVRVLHAHVECPSVSPDQTRIAFKRAVGRGEWRIAVLELSSMRETMLNEGRNVDDQLEWLDNTHVLYELSSSEIWKHDVMSVQSDGAGSPEVFLENAGSPTVID